MQQRTDCKFVEAWNKRNWRRRRRRIRRKRKRKKREKKRRKKREEEEEKIGKKRRGIERGGREVIPHRSVSDLPPPPFMLYCFA